MTASRESIHKRLKAWIVSEGGVTSQSVILGADDGPAPAPPYVSFRILSGPDGDGELERLRPPAGSDSEMFSWFASNDILVSLEAFGEDANGRIRRLRDSLRIRQVADSLCQKYEMVVEVSSAVEDDDYTLRIEGGTVTVTCEAGWTETDVRDALVDAVNDKESDGLGRFNAVLAEAVDGSDTQLSLYLPGYLGAYIEIADGGSWITEGAGDNLEIISETEAVQLAYKGAASNIRDLSRFLGMGFQSRAQIDLVFTTDILDRRELLTIQGASIEDMDGNETEVGSV